MSPTSFDHIAIAVSRMADAPPFLEGVLGGLPESGQPAGVFAWGTWQFDGGGRIEILEPRGRDGFVHRFLARQGAGIHHVTFKVPSLRGACDVAEAHGYTIVGYDDSDPAWSEAFLHPRQALGIVVQIVESRGVSDPARRPPWTPPPGAPHPPPPVRVLGLRMRAHAPERARLQWQTLLDGVATPPAGGGLLFRWPGSPMRLRVEIDPGADEGALAIEIAAARPPVLPAGRHPVLGAAFVMAAEGAADAHLVAGLGVDATPSTGAAAC